METWLLIGPGLRWMFPDRNRRIATRGREVGETGQRNKDWRRKYGTGRELRCANWVEAVGVDSVEMQEGCVEDERRVRDVMESRRRRKWKCILSG